MCCKNETLVDPVRKKIDLELNGIQFDYKTNKNVCTQSDNIKVNKKTGFNLFVCDTRS